MPFFLRDFLLPSIKFFAINRIPFSVVIFGFFARILLLFTNTNFDFESYKITSDLVLHGEPPWRSNRYNYGLPWSLVLAIFNAISFDSDLVFRFIIIVFLSSIDLTIAIILTHWFSKKIGIIFFLNPISILITGHFNQFDNWALATGMVGLISLEKYLLYRRRLDFIIAISFFSISISVKHILVIFLAWFFFLNLEFSKKLLLVLTPIAIFLLQFLPFMLISRKDFESITSSVFKYWSANNAPFWKFWIPNKEFAESLGDFHAWHHGRLWMLLMFVAVSATGFVVKSKSLPKQFAIFTVSLLIFSSAITSQFLAISAIGAAVYFNLGFLLYFLLETLFLVQDPAGLGYLNLFGWISIRGWNSWNTAPFLLTLGVLVNFVLMLRSRELIKSRE